MNIGDVVIIFDSTYDEDSSMFIGKYGLVVDLHSDDSVEVELYAEIVPIQQRLTAKFKERDLEKIGEQTIWREQYGL